MFCTNCGAQIPDGSRFCTNCGAALAAPIPTPAAPAAPAAPVTPAVPFVTAEPTPYEAAPTEAAPVYNPQPEVQQPVYQPPVYTSQAAPIYQQPVYAPPVENMETAAKKKSGKKTGLILGIVAALAVIVLAALLLPKLLGSKVEGPTYVAVSASMGGVEIKLNDVIDGDFTITLGDKGKCLITIGDEKAKGTYTEENGRFHVEGGGLVCDGTMAANYIDLENVLGMGVTIRLTENGDPAETESHGSGNLNLPASGSISAPDVAGTYIARGCTNPIFEGEILAIDDMFGQLSITLNEDGTALLSIQDDPEEEPNDAEGTWELDGEALTVSFTGEEDGESYTLTARGTLKNGAMVFDNFFESIEEISQEGAFGVYLYKEGVDPDVEIKTMDDILAAMGLGGFDEPTPEPEPEPEPAPAPEPEPSPEPANSAAGRYICLGMGTPAFGDYVIDVNEAMDGTLEITLNTDGSASASLGEYGSTVSGSYTLNGEAITINITDEAGVTLTVNGTLSGNKLFFPNFFESNPELADNTVAAFYFYREGTEPDIKIYTLAELTEALISASVNGISTQDAYDFWDGDWYGWWLWKNVSGFENDLEGAWWDGCAQIRLEDDGTGTFVFWDEDDDDGTYIMDANITISPDGSTGYGTMISQDGNIYGEYTIKEGEWVVDPGNTDYPNTILIQGHYEDEERSFDFNIFLRPWGTIWDDLDEDLLPGYYESWYLPLVQAEQDMPFAIEAD